MDPAHLVQNIKIYCFKKGVKPTVACRESGVGSSFINNIEVRGSMPSVEKVQMLAEYLGITTSDLLGETFPEHYPPDDSKHSSKKKKHGGKEQLQAAFWGGDKDLTQEEKDAMWDDVERFAAFLAQQKKQERQKND